MADPNVANHADLTNLIQNPSAEISATDGGMNGTNATLARTTDVANVGSAAFQLTSTGAFNVSVRNSTAKFAVTPGLPYSAAAEFRAAATPRSCRVYIDWYDSANARIGTVTSGANVTNTTTGWVRAIVENRVAPSNAVTAQVIAEAAATSAAGEVHYVDAIMAIQSPTITRYFDGDSGFGYSWDGEPHKSTSSYVWKKSNLFGDDLYDAVQPLAFADEDYDYALKTVAYALGQPFSQLDELLRSTDVPWSPIMDAINGPGYVLPYLAQFSGATVPVGTPAEEARDMVRFPANQERGTASFIVATAKRFLTGTKYALLTERDGSAYRLRLNVRSGESGLSNGTYIVNEANAVNSPLIANLLHIKPVGIVFTVVVTTSTTVDELAGTVDTLPGSVNTL